MFTLILVIYAVWALTLASTNFYRRDKLHPWEIVCWPVLLTIGGFFIGLSKVKRWYKSNG